MKIIKVLAFMWTAALLQACATPSYEYRPETIQVSEPPLSTINTAYVGDTLLVQGFFIEHDAIYLDQEVRVGLIGNYTFSKGYYTKTGGGDNVGFYLPSKYDDGGTISAGVFTDPFKIIEAQYNPRKLCGVSVFNGKVCKMTNFELTKQRGAGTNSFQQTLIYSGKVGNRINFEYREFSNDIARPAFNNDVEYDLSASNIIGYKGARLEVIEATNELIRYKVLSNFN